MAASADLEMFLAKIRPLGQNSATVLLTVTELRSLAKEGE